MQRTRRFGEDSERERAKAEKRCVLAIEHVDEPRKTRFRQHPPLPLPPLPPRLFLLFLLFLLVSSSFSSSSSLASSYVSPRDRSSMPAQRAALPSALRLNCRLRRSS